jgi:hypothetical protein
MRLAQARMLLAMPAANAQAQEDAEAFMKRLGNIEINTCSHCQGRLRVVEHRAADASAVLALRALRAQLVPRGAAHAALHSALAAVFAWVL